MDREKVIKGLIACTSDNSQAEDEWHDCENCPYGDICATGNTGIGIPVMLDALALLKEQENILKEYEKLSQVCFKIEKYLRIADLSMLIDRIEEGKVEVLQDDGRPDSMETTIKIRRM